MSGAAQSRRLLVAAAPLVTVAEVLSTLLEPLLCLDERLSADYPVRCVEVDAGVGVAVGPEVTVTTLLRSSGAPAHIVRSVVWAHHAAPHVDVDAVIELVDVAAPSFSDLTR